MGGVTLDYETVDRIALASMKDQLEFLRSDVEKHDNEGIWMHPDDYANAKLKYIPALELLIDYYGG
mgnify:CR=1 FL=1